MSSDTRFSLFLLLVTFVDAESLQQYQSGAVYYTWVRWRASYGTVEVLRIAISGTNGPDILISARDLAREFDGLQAVDGISFEVSRGETFGFLGPNGAGKTTTIRMLTAQLLPSGGDARVAGYDIRTQEREVQSRIGVVFELPNVYKRLSAIRKGA